MKKPAPKIISVHNILNTLSKFQHYSSKLSAVIPVDTTAKNQTLETVLQQLQLVSKMVVSFMGPSIT